MKKASPPCSPGSQARCAVACQPEPSRSASHCICCAERVAFGYCSGVWLAFGERDPFYCSRLLGWFEGAGW